MSAPVLLPVSYRSSLGLLGGRILQGHVVDLGDLACRPVVEVLADGRPIGLLRADGFDDDLGAECIGDGCYGFRFELPDVVLASAAVVAVRLANTNRIVGRPIELAAERLPDPDHERTGSVAWTGGAWLEGRLRIGERGDVAVKALLDGRVVAETMARDWTHVSLAGGFGYARAFRLRLPDHLADGRVRRIEVVASDGTPLRGSPCVHLDFKDGLQHFIAGVADLEAERIRAETFDALVPRSAPFGAVERWQAQFRPDRPSGVAGFGPVGIVLVGAGDLAASRTSLEGQTEPSWTAAVLPEGAGLRFAPEDLRAFLNGEGRDCDLLVFAATGTQFDPDAVRHLADALAFAPQATSAYCDRLVEQAGQSWPLLLPAFDYERCLEQGYCAPLFAMRRTAVLDGLAAGASCLDRLFNAQFDRTRAMAAAPVHCPLVLARGPDVDAAARAGDLQRATRAHLAARGLAASVSVDPVRALPSVRVTRAPVPERLSVIIPSGFRPAPLIDTLRMLRHTTGGADPEIVVADEGAPDPLRARLDGAGFGNVRIAQATNDTNPARAINQAVRAASGSLILLLGHGLESASEGWLDEMLGRLHEPDVGAVGPVLAWPSGVVRSAGYVLGPDLSAVPAFGDRLVGEPGYGGLLDVAHECSAVSVEALLTRRTLYLDTGGLDECHLPFDFADVDYCLKLRQQGFRIVVTPHAALRGAGPAPRPEGAARRAREACNLRQRWAEALSSDPFYNPNLAFDRQPFSALAWPPRSRLPRRPERPSAWAIPPGL